MSHSSRFLASLVAVAAGCWLLPACGGSFEGDDDGDAGSSGQAGGSGKGGSGGSGGLGKGGSGAGGGSAGGGATGCEHDGQHYNDGDTFPAGDGCNNCSCDDGQVGCTNLGCPEPGCYRGDTFYPVGTFEPDSCGGGCTCEPDNTWSCTLNVCPECEELSQMYAAAIDEAKSCDPLLTGQCTQLINDGLQCSCPSFANPENANAIGTAEMIQASYSEQMCGGVVACGACLPPSSSYCSAEGRCVAVYDFGLGAACKAEGQVYDSGSSNVPDPASCNLCTCSDGQLGCDGADCPEACPPDTVYGTQCVECSSREGCDVVEHLCLPLCTDTCEAGVCINGVCKTICG